MKDRTLRLMPGAFGARSRQRRSAWALGLGFAFFTGAGPTLVSAQTVQVKAGRQVINDVKRMRQAAEEAPIPTAESVERGEVPRASVSFQPTTARSQTGSEGEDATLETPRGAVPSRVTVAGSRSIGTTADEDWDAITEESRPLSEIPELHTVVAGDTLWSLCKIYYGDPWQWPQLWALNPLITNPHWIFPGDVVRLRAADLGEAPATVAVRTPADPGQAVPRITTSRAGLSGTDSPVLLREVGFLDTGEMRAAGRITGSREEKIMLSSGDQAYVAFPRQKPLRAGERYSVFSVDRESPVIDPATKKVIGYLVRIYGDILIEQIVDEDGSKDILTGRGTLVDMTDAVERGYHVSQAVKPFKRVAIRPSNVNLQANVIASFSPANFLAPANFVVLSRGASDGIEVGNRTYVIRRGDGYARLLEGWEPFDPNFPKEVVAELLVVDVRDKTAVAWIARATKEIRVGETTEMRKGY